MKLEIRKRDRRALLVLAFGVFAYVLLSTAVLPAFDRLQSASQDVGDKEETLMRYRRAVIRKGHYGQLLEQARKNLTDGEGKFIRGDNASLAAVELQNIVEEAAKKLEIALSQRNVSTARKKD